MGQTTIHKRTLKKGLFTNTIYFILDSKKIKGKNYLMQLGGFETKREAEDWMKHLKELNGGRTRYTKPGVLAVAREGRSGPWAVWEREEK
jgi:hypothetical protein